jgi:hypothetical protein
MRNEGPCKKKKKKKKKKIPSPSHKSLRLSVNAKVALTCTGRCVSIGRGRVQNAVPETGCTCGVSAATLGLATRAATPPHGMRTPSPLVPYSLRLIFLSFYIYI